MLATLQFIRFSWGELVIPHRYTGKKELTKAIASRV